MSHSPIFCPVCDAKAEAGCDCEAGYISASAYAAKAIARNPEMSNRALAEQTGVNKDTIRHARQLTGDNSPVEPRIGLDGKRRKMPKKVTRPATKDEAPPTAYRRIDTRTGENISNKEGLKRDAAHEATRDLESKVIELEAEVARLTYELGLRPCMDDLRRIDAIANHVQRITTDIDTYNLFRRCLHPDSRNSVSDEILHKAWLAFRNLEALTFDKSRIPPPLPKTIDDLWRMREAAKEARKRSKAV